MDQVANSVTSLEAPVGAKNKGGRNTKTAAAKDLKQKRLDKKTKKAGKPSGLPI